MRIYLSIQFFVKQGFFVGRAFLGELLLRGVAVCGGKVTEVGGKYANTSVDWGELQWPKVSMTSGEGLRKWRAFLLKLP